MPHLNWHCQVVIQSYIFIIRNPPDTRQYSTSDSVPPESDTSLSPAYAV